MDHMGVLVPIFAVAIPLVAVTGRVIVQPIVNAILRMTEAQERLAASKSSDERLTRMEVQLQLMEQTMSRVSEAQDFQGRLLEQAPAPQAAPSA
jgi:hypothetical protein